MTVTAPLQLTLDPIVPSRTPVNCGIFEYGFRVRLPDGPVIDRGDPLLAAYGARVRSIDVDRNDDDALQSDAFVPGSTVRLAIEDPDPDGPAVGVWDAEGLRCAGHLSGDCAEVVCAAIECGLEQSAIVLIEDRSTDDGRRCGLDLLVFHPGFVGVDTAAREHYQRPTRPVRRRLVLVADGTGDVRWWDPAADVGPIAAEDLPMPDELCRELSGLRKAYAEAQSESESGPRGFEHLESQLDRYFLDERAVKLWQRARVELGRDYAIGFLGSGMERPVWSPDQLGEDEDDAEVPF